MSSSSQKNAAHESAAKALLDSITELGFDLKNMEEMQRILINSDHNTLKRIEENFCLHFRKLIKSKDIPIFSLTIPLNDQQLNDLHRFYSILHLFNFNFNEDDLNFLIKKQNIEIELILDLIYDSLKNALSNNEPIFTKLYNIVYEKIVTKVNIILTFSSLTTQNFIQFQNLINILMLRPKLTKQTTTLIQTVSNVMLSNYENFILSEESRNNYFGILLIIAESFLKFQIEKAMEILLLLYESISAHD